MTWVNVTYILLVLVVTYKRLVVTVMTFNSSWVVSDYNMSNSQKVAIFFIPFLIDYLQIYVIDVHS